MSLGTKHLWSHKCPKKWDQYTLIALVITIIVLLILAGITIATLTGDNGLLTKAGQAKNTSEQANLEEEVQLALIEGQTDKYFNSNSNMEEKLKAIFEKSYGQGNIDVTKAGKNCKVKVKDSKTAYRVRYDGKVEKYEEMDPTSIYARLDDDGVLYLRATQIDNRYNLYNGSTSIKSDWNSSNDASTQSIVKVILEEKIAPTSTSNMFYRCSNLEIIDNIYFLHTEHTNSMHQMFYGCNALKELKVDKFDTNNVRTMHSMFQGCKSLTSLDVSGFDTTVVTDMGDMFTFCGKIDIIDVENFNTSNVTSMYQMFYGCSSVKKLEVSNFDTSKVTSMKEMFYGCNSVNELIVKNFKTNNVNNMSGMFQSCNRLTSLDLSGFDTTSVTSMSNMFVLCGNISTLNLESFDTSYVTNMNKMFYGCGKLSDLNMGNKFNIKDSTNIDEMFTKFTGIKVKTTQDTANRLKAKFTNFTDNNFEIIE